MDSTEAKVKAQEAFDDLKASAKSAADAAKAGVQSVKDKAVAAHEEKMRTDPEYKEKVEKTEGFFDNLKDKTADLLRKGADGVKNLADKIDN